MCFGLYRVRSGLPRSCPFRLSYVPAFQLCYWRISGFVRLVYFFWGGNANEQSHRGLRMCGGGKGEMTGYGGRFCAFCAFYVLCLG